MVWKGILLLLMLWADTASAQEACRWYTCAIRVDLGGGAYRGGSGVPVWCEKGKTLILTNAHVVRKDTANLPISVGTCQGWKKARYLDGSDVKEQGHQLTIDGLDLCLLEIDAELGAVEMAKSPVQDGEYCGHYGFGGSSFEKGSIYRFGEVMKNDLGKDHLRFSSHTIQGDSGAGIFNARGELIGLVWGEHYGVTLPQIKEFCQTRDAVKKHWSRWIDRLR